MTPSALLPPLVQLTDEDKDKAPRIFASPEEARLAIGTFCRVNWKSQTYNNYLVLRIDGVRADTENRYFLQVTSLAVNTSIELSLSYAHVPLTEQEAIERVNHLRQQNLSRVQKPVPLPKGTSLDPQENVKPKPEPEQKTKLLYMETTEQKATKAKVPTAYSTLSAALRGGKTKEQAVAEAKAAWPDGEHKKYMPMAHSIVAQLKKKAAASGQA